MTARNVVPACWLTDQDCGSLVEIHDTGIPVGRLEGAHNTFRLTVLKLDGVEYVISRDQLIVLDSFTAERFEADGDRRRALDAGELLFRQPEVFKLLRDGDSAVDA